MATPVYVPRINNNDDEVKVLGFEVVKGAKVLADQILGQIETDKAVMDVTAPEAGYLLGFVGQPDEVVKVGSILLWIGKTAEEEIPEMKAELEQPGGGGSSQVTAKARLLLNRHGLSMDAVAPVNGRVTVEVVERYLAESGRKVDVSIKSGGAAVQPSDPGPNVAGNVVDLTREEKGMAATVSWHRDFAVPGYIEIEYETAPWVEYAKFFQEKNGLLMPPLLPLMAWRLVQVVKELPRINATFVAGKRYEYGPVNLGFTIQAGEALYLAVVRESHSLDELAFVNGLGDVLRRAAGHNLRESETSGATIGFSSMERWKVTRHVPILPPHTAFMVAHAAGHEGKAVLGASYDHRVLNGGQVVSALKKIATPPKYQ